MEISAIANKIETFRKENGELTKERRELETRNNKIRALLQQLEQLLKEMEALNQIDREQELISLIPRLEGKRTKYSQRLQEIYARQHILERQIHYYTVLHESYLQLENDPKNGN